MKRKEPNTNTIYSASASANVRWTFERIDGKNTTESKSVLKHCYTIQFGGPVKNTEDSTSSDPERNGYY